MTPAYRILRHTRQPRCPICNEPVKLETCKTDEDGHAVHDDCYIAKLSGKVPLVSRHGTGMNRVGPDVRSPK